MDAFGRMIAVSIGTIGLIFLLLFYRTASVRWQKAETIRSMSRMYAERLLQNKRISHAEWETFQAEINRLGNYRAELTVYERRRFEGENGRIYLFSEWEQTDGEKILSEGSYIRLLITEQPKGKLETVLYGEACTVLAGGRVS